MDSIIVLAIVEFTFNLHNYFFSAFVKLYQLHSKVSDSLHFSLEDRERTKNRRNKGLIKNKQKMRLGFFI